MSKAYRTRAHQMLTKVATSPRMITVLAVQGTRVIRKAHDQLLCFGVLHGPAGEAGRHIAAISQERIQGMMALPWGPSLCITLSSIREILIR